MSDIKKPQIVSSPCRQCDCNTKHEVLFSAEESEYDYRVDRYYQVVECRGCGTKSFRKSVQWIEESYQIDDDEWEVPEDVETFPKVLKGHKAVPDIDRVPEIVGEIYKQSLEAITNKSTVLAGIGLRATIEAICNERSVTGRSLEQRIDKLARAGLVSTSDADRLHAIRFLGNDAAHEIQAADPVSLLIALRIVENLLINLYILDTHANGVLETLIKTYAEFEKLLNSKLSAFAVGDNLPLARLLGRDARRFHGYLKAHETELMANIKAGTYGALKLGNVQPIGGNAKDQAQHFIVA